MRRGFPTAPVVHLELHTRDLEAASSFYGGLCGWPEERISCPSGSYLGLDLGRDMGGGIVECGAEPAVWLPYVEVGDVALATERARRLGASVLLGRREGPAGWRSVVSAPDGGQVAFWQPKR
jgi:predicted enzyme related to lactoylglutathione lyase